MCNPLLDISAVVEPEFLKKYDLGRGQALLAEEKHFPLYKELNKYKLGYLAGGAGQNSIRVCQWMLKENPKSTYFVGCVGKDENGKKLKEIATEDGVEVHYMEIDETPTGVCAVLVSDKERTLVANLSAAEKYKQSHFDSKEIQDILNSSQTFYATGFFITHSFETLMALGRFSTKNNKTFMVNLSAPFLIEFFNEKLNQVLNHADVIFGNEHEGFAYGKSMGFGEDLKEIAKRVQAMKREGTENSTKRKRIVIFTHGSQPAIICDENGQVHEIAPIKLKKEEIVDSNGAGDAFVGGFLAAWSLNKDLEKCVKAGFYAASEILKVEGTNVKGRTPTFSFD